MYSKRKILESNFNASLNYDEDFNVIWYPKGGWRREFDHHSISSLVRRIDSKVFIVDQDFFIIKHKYTKAYLKDDIIIIDNGGIINLNEPKKIMPLITNKGLLRKLNRKILKAITKKLKIDNIDIYSDRLHYSGDYDWLGLCITGEGIPTEPTLDIIEETIQKFITKYHKKTGDYISLGELDDEVCDAIYIKIFDRGSKKQFPFPKASIRRIDIGVIDPW